MQPVGSGPFAMQAINVTGLTPDTRQEEVQLKPFANYYGGKPKLNSFIIHSFHNQDQMIRAFNSQELDAMIGLNTLPDNVANESAVQQYDFPLTAENMVFFKTSTGVLSDVNVRQALVTGANIPQVILNLGYSANQVREPLLENQLGYNKAYQQTPYNFNQAAQILTNDGWIVGKDGIRYNKGQRLTFGLYAQDSNEYATVARILKQQWRKLGVDVQVYLQQDANMQATLAYHAYDALLYGISIGPDPDTFVYWDSTQADVRSNTRLNFAEYKSSIADAALEAGRTRSDPALRAIKYQPFLKAWQQDAPALGLYQPRFLYVTRGKVFNLDQHTINVDTDRYENVQNWMIRQAPQNIVK
jgi:peptide/nickel transport system substrate-binding protein